MCFTLSAFNKIINLHGLSYHKHVLFNVFVMHFPYRYLAIIASNPQAFLFCTKDFAFNDPIQPYSTNHK